MASLCDICACSPGIRAGSLCLDGGVAGGVICCSSLVRVERSEMLPSLQLASPSFHIMTSPFSSRFSRRSSRQMTTSYPGFVEPSARVSSSSHPFRSSTSSRNPDTELVGASQSTINSSSAAVRAEISSCGNRNLGNVVLSKLPSEPSEAPGFARQRDAKQSSDVSRSSETTSRSSVGFTGSTNFHPKNLPEASPPSTKRTPYFKASNESYKARVLQAARIVAQQAADSTLTLSSSNTTPVASPPKKRNQNEKITDMKTISPSRKTSSSHSRNHVPSAVALADSSGLISRQLTIKKGARGADVLGKVTSNTDSLLSPRLSSSSLLTEDTPSSRMPTQHLSQSDLSSGALSSEGKKDNSPSADEIPQRVSSPLRKSRKDSNPVLSSSESLDRLHQHLEEQARENSSKAILQKPLDAEEAIRLRDRLKGQKEKSVQEIHRRLFQNRLPDGRGGEFSCAVDPETLIPGEFVVHKRVGVGKYIGMKDEVAPGQENPSKYIYLKYADGTAKLKAKQAQRLLYRYHLPGEIGRAPSLSKLKDPGMWEKRKSKGKIAIQKMVVNMMELYIHRLKQSRPLYSKNKIALTEFAAHFPHTPTRDQLQAFGDVERDMTERDLPMDRLICGDVGFGKTEVALRALFIATAAGKQVMVLTPSTVLAKQHYETIRDRFAMFPGIKVALLCRFQRDSERKELIMGIHDGSLHIVVGTHALLGNHIRYHNLGLLVIDEEQRFGVKQKERITCLKTSVDVLTLSATPIPRTLYLAMSGFRDASLLTTPPPERRPIQTHLLEYNEGMAITAIQFELDRGGQVFYVVPRVKGIESLLETLQSQFPDIKMALAHGKQSASALEDSMEKFCEGETRILICTNIIESGLDIRMVNTIIVEDVHLFGLAQLYQLRGRVGRAHREAHAYLFHPHKSHLTDEALERLVALQDCCDLGQGFQLAERDMAIRGIGSLFGEQQSGDAAKIGTDLYFEMLLEGLSKVDDQHLPHVEYDDVQLELVVDAHIPSDYIKSAEEREHLTRSAEGAAKESLRALMISTMRLRDNYGKEPASVEMLLKTIYIRRMAADLGIHRIRPQHTSVLMETNMSSEAFEVVAASIQSDAICSSLTFKNGFIEMQGLIGVPQERQMERIFCCLVEMVNSLPSFVKYI